MKLQDKHLSTLLIALAVLVAAALVILDLPLDQGRSSLSYQGESIGSHHPLSLPRVCTAAGGAGGLGAVPSQTHHPSGPGGGSSGAYPQPGGGRPGLCHGGPLQHRGSGGGGHPFGRLWTSFPDPAGGGRLSGGWRSRRGFGPLCPAHQPRAFEPGEITLPTLILGTTSDDVAPPEQLAQLYNSLSGDEILATGFGIKADQQDISLRIVSGYSTPTTPIPGKSPPHSPSGCGIPTPFKSQRSPPAPLCVLSSGAGLYLFWGLPWSFCTASFPTAPWRSAIPFCR